MRPSRILSFASALVLGVALLASCTTEKIVFRDRDPFNPPPDQVNGFLGYYTVATQQTTCGNCHVDFQATWKDTKHAHAYLTLDTLATAQESCFGCHTVNGRGNDAPSPSGWDVVQDSAYQDVQCESCHGPGLEHIEGVSAGNITVRPFAKISPTGEGSCADCHSGTHHPFVEQWSLSKHAVANERQTRATCAGCHGARGVLARWGVQSDYVEKNTSDLLPVATCATCHNPHGSSNDHQLRLSITSPDPAQHLCMSCHLREVHPEVQNSRGNNPHGVQGGVLMGFAGWRPPGFVYDTARIFGSHATTANPKLCAGCHVNRFRVTDASGGFVFQSTGHQFEAAPCVDAQGVPSGETECAFTTAARNWSACTNSGCHNVPGDPAASQQIAANLYNSAKLTLKNLADIIWSDLNGDRRVDPFPTDGGYLPRILVNAPCSGSYPTSADDPCDLNPRDATLTAADGSEFNARLCGVELDSHQDGSFGAHNKFLCEALLSSSASYLRSVYTFLPAPPPAIQAYWDRWSTQVATGGPGQPVIRRESFPIMPQ